MYQGMVEFDNEGNHLRKAGWYSRRNGVTNKPNFIFKDTLTLVSIRSNEVQWKSLHTGKTYTSFIGDLAKFITRMEKGVISSMFTFRNNGGYTSLIPTVFEYEDHTQPQETMKIDKGNAETMGKLYAAMKGQSI